MTHLHKYRIIFKLGTEGNKEINYCTITSFLSNGILIHLAEFTEYYLCHSISYEFLEKKVIATGLSAIPTHRNLRDLWHSSMLHTAKQL